MKSDFPIDNKPKLRSCPFCGNKAYLIGLFVPYDDDAINEARIHLWREICRKKIGEAYAEYMKQIIL